MRVFRPSGVGEFDEAETSRAEEIVRKLRDAEIAQSEGKTIPQICKQLEISEQTCHRWKKQYGGVSRDEAKRLKKLEMAGKAVGHRSRQATEVFAHFAPDALKRTADERARAKRKAMG